MSIYATINEWTIRQWLPDGSSVPRRIFFQGVPSWVDFEASWLPPPIRDEPLPDGRIAYRVIIVVDDRTDKGGHGLPGQQYYRELARLTQIEYDATMATKQGRDRFRRRLRRVLVDGEGRP